MPCISYVCVKPMVAVLPYANQYFHCILWQTVNTRMTGSKQLSSTMFMKYMHLSYQFFSFLSGELELTV